MARLISSHYDLATTEHMDSDPDDQIHMAYLTGLKHGVLFSKWIADPEEPVYLERK